MKLCFLTGSRSNSFGGVYTELFTGSYSDKKRVLDAVATSIKPKLTRPKSLHNLSGPLVKAPLTPSKVTPSPTDAPRFGLRQAYSCLNLSLTTKKDTATTASAPSTPSPEKKELTESQKKEKEFLEFAKSIEGIEFPDKCPPELAIVLNDNAKVNPVEHLKHSLRRFCTPVLISSASQMESAEQLCNYLKPLVINACSSLGITPENTPENIRSLYTGYQKTSATTDSASTEEANQPPPHFVKELQDKLKHISDEYNPLCTRIVVKTIELILRAPYEQTSLV